MKYKEYVKFPCGLETKMSIETGFMESVATKLSFDLEKIICPIHGKKCRGVKQ